MKEYKELDDSYIYDILDNLDLKEIGNQDYIERVSINETNKIKSKVVEKIKSQTNSKERYESNKLLNENKEVKKKFSTKLRKQITVAVVFMIAIIGIFIGGQVSRANKIPNNSSVEAYGMEIDKDVFKKYSTPINKLVTDNGINVNIKNVLIDKNAMWIEYIVYSDKFDFIRERGPTERPSGMSLLSGLNININGADSSKTGGTGSSSEVIDKNTINFIQLIDIKDTKVNGVLDIEFNATNIEEFEGNWNTKFKIDTKDINSQSKEYRIERVFCLGESIYRIKSIVISPIQTSIYYSAIGKGNETIDFKIINEDGDEFIRTVGSYSSKFFMGKGEIRYTSLMAKGDTITIIPKRGDVEEKEIKININK